MTLSSACVYIINEYDRQMLEGNVNSDEYIPPNVMDTMRNIECDFLQFTEDTFYCLEKFVKTKKKDILGIEPLEIVTLCTACRIGETKAHNKKLDDERIKANTKKLEEFVKDFYIITDKGFKATTYLCMYGIKNNSLLLSEDDKHIQCPLLNKNNVVIKEVCETKLNPNTLKTPCPYLIALDHDIQLSKEDLEKMGLTIPLFEESIVDNKPYLELGRKTVDSEIEIEDDVLDSCPKCSEGEMIEEGIDHRARAHRKERKESIKYT